MSWTNLPAGWLDSVRPAPEASPRIRDSRYLPRPQRDEPPPPPPPAARSDERVNPLHVPSEAERMELIRQGREWNDRHCIPTPAATEAEWRMRIYAEQLMREQAEEDESDEEATP